jgi:4,5-dihydroxyphthalate decarboxylase
MSEPSITFVVKDYDYIAPLVCGDVVAEGMALQLERDTPRALDRTLNDPSVDAGELSFCRYVMRLASGDRSLVGIPFFAYRAFRQRCYFVRCGSKLDLKQLEGKRIGTNEWPASGNVWTRALLREQGVPLANIRWWVGPVDDPNAPQRPQGSLPPYVELMSPGQTLGAMLLAGDVDAIMCPNPPRAFYEADRPIVRLFDDFRRAEREYYRRTQLYPPQHIVGIRREVLERHPWVASRLYDVLERSRLLWQERRRTWAEVSPWFLAELEEVTELMGYDWQPNGYEANQAAIQTFCDELYAQGLIAHALDGATVFAEFQEMAKG